MSIFEQLADRELLPQALGFAILAPDINWTSKIMGSAKRVCQYIKSKATRMGNQALANKMSFLIEDFIGPRLDCAAKQRKSNSPNVMRTTTTGCPNSMLTR